MMRSSSLACLLAAAAAILAAPAAMAGSDIVKCVDGGGHVTLTDQPCPSGSSGVRLSTGVGADGSAAQGGSGTAGSTGSSDPEPVTASATPTPQRHVLPAADLRHASWKQPAARPAPLAADVATLKAARRMLLQETQRPKLAAAD